VWPSRTVLAVTRGSSTPLAVSSTSAATHGRVLAEHFLPSYFHLYLLFLLWLFTDGDGDEVALFVLIIICLLTHPLLLAGLNSH
jgi:hypothetical protein